MSRLPPGRHWPGDSFWHRRDPLAKLLLVLCLVVPVAAARGLTVLAVLAALLALVWAWAGLPLRLLLGAWRSFAWLLAVTAAANLLFTPGASRVATWPPRLTPASLSAAGLNAWRLLLLLTLGAWLTGTTSPLALTRALGRALKPLGRLGFPVEDLILIVGLGLRLLPDLLEAGGRIRMAQRARGVGAGRGIRARLHGAEALALALFSYAFRRAEELALAMEARGYRRGSYGAFVARGRMSAADLGVLAAGAGAAAALTWLWR
ncbi:MAG: energy-coupling factor transporter transmembrane component T family protein [Patescibacteria group bacterium]